MSELLQAECITGALSIHSPDCVFTFLASIFISKTHFLSVILVLQTRLHRYVYICILANRPGISGIVPDLASRCAGNIQNFSRNWVLSKLKTKADYVWQ